MMLGAFAGLLATTVPVHDLSLDEASHGPGRAGP
jgi:hypothetical protein